MDSILVFTVGLCIGSFLNVVIWRLHTGGTFGGRSQCPHCSKTLSWWELVPLVSYLVLRGRCSACREGISLYYPLVELSTGLLFLAAYLLEPRLEFFIRDAIFIAILIVLFVYDLRWYLLPDRVTLPALAIALVYNAFLVRPHDVCIFDSCAVFQGWMLLGLSVLFGGGFFLFQYLISKGRWVGGGDIRLGALMGAMLSWPGILGALLVAYIVGAVAGVGLLLSGKRSFGQEIPFGPFLAAATACTLLFEREVRMLLTTLYGV